MVDAARVGALIAVPRLRGELDLVLFRRDPSRHDARPGWTWRDAVVVAGLLVSLLAAGVMLPSPRNGRTALPVDDALAWSALCAAGGLLVFVSAERARRGSRLLGAHTRTAAKLFVIVSIVWTLVLAYVLAHAGDLDGGALPPPAVWMLLLAVAIAGMATLAIVAHRRDRIALTDPAVAARDERGIAPTDVDPLIEWWARFPKKLSPAERGAADASYATTIDLLERERVIRGRDARRLRRKKPPVVWAGAAD